MLNLGKLSLQVRDPSAQSKVRTTKPLLGFGSNQVLFGGIIKSASATSRSSSMVQGCMAMAATQSVSHRLTSS